MESSLFGLNEHINNKAGNYKHIYNLGKRLKEINKKTIIIV
jgi:hypothetical protein